MKPVLRLLAPFAIAGVVLYALFAWSGVRPADVVRAASEVEPVSLMAALGILVLLYAARAARIRVLLPEGERPPAVRLGAATAAWILDAQVLPAKVGEATLVWHLSRLGVPKAEAFVALAVSRMLDLAVLLGAFGVAALGLGLGAEGERLPWLVPLGATLVPAALVLGALVWRGADAWRVVPATLSRIGLAQALGGRILSFAERVGEALAAVTPARRWSAVGWSLPVWALILGFYALLARALGVDLGAFGLIFGASLAVLGGLVPASGFLGFGMLDVGWVAGYSALGVPRELAVESGLAFHVLYLAGVGLLGVLGHATLTRRKN